MQDLYRVETIREFNGDKVRCTKYFSTKEGMDAYIEEWRKKGVKIISSQHFRLVEDEQ